MKLPGQPADAPKPAIVLRVHAERLWRGLGDPLRSAESHGIDSLTHLG
jgi:hypothetical protein